LEKTSQQVECNGKNAPQKAAIFKWLHARNNKRKIINT
jgi:hypothetical protein